MAGAALWVIWTRSKGAEGDLAQAGRGWARARESRRGRQSMEGGAAEKGDRQGRDRETERTREIQWFPVKWMPLFSSWHPGSGQVSLGIECSPTARPL